MPNPNQVQQQDVLFSGSTLNNDSSDEIKRLEYMNQKELLEHKESILSTLKNYKHMVESKKYPKRTSLLSDRLESAKISLEVVNAEINKRRLKDIDKKIKENGMDSISISKLDIRKSKRVEEEKDRIRRALEMVANGSEGAKKIVEDSINTIIGLFKSSEDNKLIRSAKPSLIKSDDIKLNVSSDLLLKDLENNIESTFSQILLKLLACTKDIFK